MKNSKKVSNKNISTLLSGVLALMPWALLAGVALMIFVREGVYLWRLQELNLFLPTRLFFRQSMIVPGGLLQYLGQMMTQMGYYPWLGGALLVGSWAAVMAMARRAFRVPDCWQVLLAAVVALLAVSCFGLGYFVYYLKLRGFLFASSLGVLFVVGAVWLWRRLPLRWCMPEVGLVLTVGVGYPLFGAYALAAALTVAVMAWRRQGWSMGHKLACCIVAIVGVGLTPYIYYNMVYYQTPLPGAYFAAMPVFYADGMHWEYYIPYVALLACFLLMAALYREKPEGETQRPWLWIAVQTAIYIIIIVYTGTQWYRDGNFYTELRMHRAIERQDYEQALSYAQKAQRPTRLIWVLKNISLAHLGRQGDEMYHYPNGSTPSRAPFRVSMVHTDGKMIYLSYGQANYCYRWCMEDGVEFGWGAEELLLMLKCSLVNGNWAAARRYADLLGRTLFYSTEAQRLAAYIGHPGALRRDKELGRAIHLLDRRDQLTSDNMMLTTYLLNHFARLDSRDPILQEQTLLFALEGRNSKVFWSKFWRYLRLHPHERIPTHYQEAAWMLAQMEGGADVSHVAIEPQTKQRFADFMQAANRCRGMSTEQVRLAMRPQFGDTYFYEYLLGEYQRAE